MFVFILSRPTIIRGAVGALMVYDITNQKSFDGIEKWMKELREASYEGDEVVCMLIGNKVSRFGALS